jgi:hypothetical protein
LRKAIARLSKEITSLKAPVEKLKRHASELANELEKIRRQNRVVYNPAGGVAKKAWLVEITDARLVVAKVGAKDKPLTFDGADRLDNFMKWAGTRKQGLEYFVLLIKPSGVKSFAAVHERLKRAGFDMGFDVLTTDQTAIDPDLGAALR